MKPTLSLWKRCRYRLEWLGVFLLIKLVPLVPRRFLLFLARVLGPLVFLLDQRGRTTTLENLRAVYGDELDEPARRQLARRCYQSFARTYFDYFWTPRLDEANTKRYCRIELDDEEAVDAAMKDAAIWITPHYGNFEWTSLKGRRDLRLCIITKEFKNPLLTELFNQHRERSGHQVIPQRNAVFRLIKHLKNGEHVGFLPDLTVPPSKAATVIEVMGLKACVTSLHAVLLQRFDLPVLPWICLPQRDGTYVLRGLRPLQIPRDATPTEIAQLCWDQFEPIIREAPEHWLWMYKHWRFLPPDADHPGENRYPAYANRSKKFDAVLEEASAADSGAGSGK